MRAPTTAQAIERAARAGELDETPSFDAKVDLPAAKRHAWLAVDVAAMPTDGGVLLYGVAEDEHKRPTVPKPIPLRGAADRVAQIVASDVTMPMVDRRESVGVGLAVR